MAKGTIMVIEDEPDALDLVQFNLREAGYRVVSATSGEKALQKIRALLPQVIVLDLMLPDIDGLELCKILKREPKTAQVPIVILTARAAEIDRILALELGAEDYLTKPFSPRELVIRVDRLVRKQQPAVELDDGEHFAIGMVSIDVPKHEVTVSGKPIVLTPIEFKLLTLLAQRRERVQSRDQLLQEVWGYDSQITSRTVDTHMRRLRAKLGRGARHLHTVRGFGYRFADI